MRTLPVVILAASMLAACATTRMSEPDKLALYTGHAGEPVRSFLYNMPAISWDRIDDSHLLLTTRPSQAWLLRVAPNCLNWGADKPTIAVSSQNGLVSAGFDRLQSPGAPVDCRIEEIRPVDVAGVRIARDAMEAANP